jgi:hypothetical protein
MPCFGLPCRKSHVSILNINLILMFTSYRFKHLFAFTAYGLIPSLLSTFLIDMAHRVIVEGFDISRWMTNLLDSSPIAARHTSIIHLRETEGVIHGLEYVWAHRQMQPWGSPLPPQCPRCFSFRPWAERKKTTDSRVVFSCKGKSKGMVCGYLDKADRPSNLRDAPPRSDWITLNWP